MTQKLTIVRSRYQTKTYEQFLEERKQGIGGSDIGDLVNSAPYGCRRRLFLDKLGELPRGNDESRRHHLERGQFFEAPVAQLYAEKRGYTVAQCGTGYIKQFPFIRANADRLQAAPGEGMSKAGTLEIKVPSAHMFRKIKKEGLPEAYILQKQYEMLCYGTKWGTFAVYWPDGHDLLWFDIDRDDGLIEQIRYNAQNTWHEIEMLRGRLLAGEDGWEQYLPPKKPASYDGCKTCPAYASCHGIPSDDEKTASVPELSSTVRQYKELGAQMTAIEKERDGLRYEIEEAFRDKKCSAIDTGNFLVLRREQTRESISLEAKTCLTEEAKRLYCKSSTYGVLTVKEKK